MDLVEFLRQRIDDDEQVARRAVRWNEGCRDWATNGEPDWEHIARHDPARVLREVEAKRRIIDGCVETLAGEDAWDPQLGGGSGEEFELARWTLKLLALPHADHPDYDESWRP